MYQFHTQVSSKERLPSIETTLHLDLCHFQRPSYVSTREGGREKRGKAHVSTCTGSYYTHYVIITSHLYHMWEDCSIFNRWAEKRLSELTNLTWQRQREPVWKATICNGLQIGGTRARNNVHQTQFQKKRETCLRVTGQSHIDWTGASCSSLPPKKISWLLIYLHFHLFKEFIPVVKNYERDFRNYYLIHLSIAKLKCPLLEEGRNSKPLLLRSIHVLTHTS